MPVNVFSALAKHRLRSKHLLNNEWFLIYEVKKILAGKISPRPSLDI
jgi:hypothetical protein